MPAPIYSAADYLTAFQGMMPRGRIWPREADAVQTKALTTLMPTYARLCERDANLLVDAFPATADELLAEWESTLGLPDPCAGLDPTLQQRRAQVVARLTAGGGQSAPYFVRFAATLGFVVTVGEFVPFRMGRARFGQPMNNPSWAHAWAIRAPQTTVTLFRLGESAFGERFRNWGNAVLVCEMTRLRPAHTYLQFLYV